MILFRSKRTLKSANATIASVFCTQFMKEYRSAALPSTTGTCVVVRCTVLRRRKRRTYEVVASKGSIALHDWRIPVKISDFHFLTFDADVHDPKKDNTYGCTVDRLGCRL